MSSSNSGDAGMYRMMTIVMGALVIFTLTVMIMARILGSHEPDPTDTLMQNALVERISPVGQVRTVAEDSSAAPMAVAAAPKTPEDLYNNGCAACHTAGVAGAPKLGDADAWAARNGAGLEALVASVINGKGAMPARGASTLSDDEIAEVVKYLTGL
jgi:cytochrome c5